MDDEELLLSEDVLAGLSPDFESDFESEDLLSPSAEAFIEDPPPLGLAA